MNCEDDLAEIEKAVRYIREGHALDPMTQVDRIERIAKRIKACQTSDLAPIELRPPVLEQFARVTRLSIQSQASTVSETP